MLQSRDLEIHCSLLQGRTHARGHHARARTAGDVPPIASVASQNTRQQQLHLYPAKATWDSGSHARSKNQSASHTTWSQEKYLCKKGLARRYPQAQFLYSTQANLCETVPGHLGYRCERSRPTRLPRGSSIGALVVPRERCVDEMLVAQSRLALGLSYSPSGSTASRSTCSWRCP